MTALTFGSSTAPLFGVYHPSLAAGRPRKAVLLCNPFGEEAIRAFRPLKRLAEMLAAEGIASLRFDYYGTGDSAGADDEVSLAQMAKDILWAVDELRELSGARKIYWLGLRLGAWGALEAAKEAKPSGLLLWEPVINGPDYLAEIGEGTKAPTESQGFPISSELLAQLQAGGPDMPSNIPMKVVGGAPVGDIGHIPAPASDEWNSDAALNSYSVPVQTLELIREEIAAW